MPEGSGPGWKCQMHGDILPGCPECAVLFERERCAKIVEGKIPTGVTHVMVSLDFLLLIVKEIRRS